MTKYCENQLCSNLAEWRVTVSGDKFNLCCRCLAVAEMVDERAVTDLVAIPLCDVEEDDDDGC